MTDKGRTEGNAHANNDSIAVGKIEIGGDVQGNITIGNTIGYSANEVSVLLQKISASFQPKPFDGRCPYKGLDVFEEEDAELFFGREKLVDDLVSRVKVSRTVFVTGPSGSGKSSLVRAGLIHALKQGAIKGSERWLYATMKPGRDPIGELGRAVSSLASSTTPEDEIRAKAMKDATIFARWCEIALKEGRDKRLVLFIDQFEEIFTQISKEEERVAFLNLLTHAATIEDGRVFILFSMRSDFVSSCATYPQLNELLNEQFKQIGAMQPEELVSAIARPALRVGLRIDPDLIAQIINEMKGEPGALPLMQFALKDLFDYQKESSGVIALTINDYLQRGGIHKALERHADNSFLKLSENEQELARSIFSGLIEIGRGTQDTKRTALFDELVSVNTKAEDVEAIVQKLADARLVTTDEQAGNDTVSISHEKLIDAWPWLKKLVNENRDVIALQNQISADAKEWEEHKRDASYLYSGGRLANVREQFEKQKLALGHLAQEFVRAGRARQYRAQVFLISAISIVLIAAIVASAIFKNQAQVNIEIANTAQAASTFAIQQQDIAQANAKEAEKQKNIALARQLDSQVKFIYDLNDTQRITSSLLAIESMKLLPLSNSAAVLQNNTLPDLIAHLTSNENYLTAVAISSEGRYVASGGCEIEMEGLFCTGGFIIRLWDTSTSIEKTIMAHNEKITSVAFSPDGKYVVSGSLDNTARVWDTTTGKEIARTTHDDDVTSVAFSPNGRYVISGGCDKGDSNNYYCILGTARVWETMSGKEIARMIHDGGQVDTVTFSPDGKYAASGGCNLRSEDLCTQGAFRVWEASTGKDVSQMNFDGAANSIAFSSDSNYVYSWSGYDNTLRTWNAITGKEISRTPRTGDDISSLSFSPDGIFTISGECNSHSNFPPFACTSSTAYIRERVSGRKIILINHEAGEVFVALSSDGKRIVSAWSDGNIYISKSGTGMEMMPNTQTENILVSPDNKYLVSNHCDIENEQDCLKSSIYVYDAQSLEEVTHLSHESNINVEAFAISPNGTTIASGGNDGIILIWETITGKEITRIITKNPIDALDFSQDGKYMASGSNGFLQIWETITGKEISRTNIDGHIYSIDFSPNGKYVVSGSYSTGTHVSESSTGKEILKTDDGGIKLVAFSPDGKYIVSAQDESLEGSHVSVIELSTKLKVIDITYSYARGSAAFSQDGKYLVSGGDNAVSIWEIGTGKEIVKMIHDDIVVSVGFSRDGKYVVSGSWDGTARVWSSNTGKEVTRMIYGNPIYFTSFSPNGNFIVTVGGDGNSKLLARIWTKWQPQDLITNACARVTRNLTRAEWKQYIGDALPYQAVCPNLPIEEELSPTATP